MYKWTDSKKVTIIVRGKRNLKYLAIPLLILACGGAACAIGKEVRESV